MTNKKQKKKNFVTAFFDEIDIGKKFPQYVDKRIFRAAFIIILIIQMVALTMTGFIFNPAWAECNINTPTAFMVDYCENPFYMATGKVCDQNPTLCTTERIKKGDIIGNKPPAFVFAANPLSWLCLIIAGVLNYLVCKYKRFVNDK